MLVRDYRKATRFGSRNPPLNDKNTFNSVLFCAPVALQGADVPSQGAKNGSAQRAEYEFYVPKWQNINKNAFENLNFRAVAQMSPDDPVCSQDLPQMIRGDLRSS